MRIDKEKLPIPPVHLPETGHIESLTRGVFVLEGQLLLCRNRNVGNLYLPGGHIDFGEQGAEALVREIREEMGCFARVIGFLGCAEHVFMQKGTPHAEINLVYRMEVEGLDMQEKPPSCESWIEFIWHPLAVLETSNLEPAALRDVLPRWVAAAASDNLVSTQNRMMH